MASIKRIGTDKTGLPIWEAVYRTGAGETRKQVRRRFHCVTKEDVQRAILLDSPGNKGGIRWSEGCDIYLRAKRQERCSPHSLEHIERARDVFVKLMGDLAIEATTADVMKTFMNLASEQPVKHRFSGKKYRESGPKVANHHKKELLTVARYLRAHTDKVATVPFEHVPNLPARKSPRSPIPKDKVMAYLDALPPHTRRPVLMILYYGLRSTATCEITLDSIDGEYLVAIDKNDVERRIPIDPMLAGIIEDAMAFRQTFEDIPPDDRKVGVPAPNLFLNLNGRGWNRMTLLHAAQRAWKRADLKVKKIHEVRHTLGTLAGKSFEAGMVQAAMGHKSRKSAEVYFHPDEDMAAEVRKAVVIELSQNSVKPGENGLNQMVPSDSKKGEFACPCCHSNLLIINKKTRKPLRLAGYEILERAKGIEPS